MLHDDVEGAWFVRDYGVAMYASTLRNEIATGEGNSWSGGLRAVAYDGPLYDDRARRWIANGHLAASPPSLN